MPGHRNPWIGLTVVAFGIAGIVAAPPPAAAEGPRTERPVGIFADHADVGDVTLPGAVSFDPETGDYVVTGSGTNMWAAADAFHVVWRRMRGDFLLRADAGFLGDGGDPHRKMGWIVRASLAPESAYVDVALHGDGLTALQFRRAAGGQTEEVRSAVTEPKVLQLSRSGGRFSLAAARPGAALVRDAEVELDLGDEVYVGVFVCSHDPAVSERGVFGNVRIVVPAPADLVPYRDYLGSDLEILDVESGRRTVVHHAEDSLQAPNWTPDGRALIYNRNGHLYRFDLESRTVSEIDTGFADHNNNDHVLSFDGTRLGISHHDPASDGRSLVYVLSASLSEPRRVTAEGPSYLHGWSPDGRYVVYTAERGGDYDIYRTPVAGGEEERLTSTPGLDDGPEYSPDGRWIYFNSVRSGGMELWRMRPDGSAPQQLTDDPFNNWFPHVSPDGAWVAFVSFGPEVDPSDHPFYREIYLRLMPAGGGEPRVLAYVYGGQGSLNVPSWSPDGRRLAFVANSAGD